MQQQESSDTLQTQDDGSNSHCMMVRSEAVKDEDDHGTPSVKTDEAGDDNDNLEDDKSTLRSEYDDRDNDPVLLSPANATEVSQSDSNGQCMQTTSGTDHSLTRTDESHDSQSCEETKVATEFRGAAEATYEAVESDCLSKGADSEDLMSMGCSDGQSIAQDNAEAGKLGMGLAMDENFRSSNGNALRKDDCEKKTSAEMECKQLIADPPNVIAHNEGTVHSQLQQCASSAQMRAMSLDVFKHYEEKIKKQQDQLAMHRQAEAGFLLEKEAMQGEIMKLGQEKTEQDKAFEDLEEQLKKTERAKDQVTDERDKARKDLIESRRSHDMTKKQQVKAEKQRDKGLKQQNKLAKQRDEMRVQRDHARKQLDRETRQHRKEQQHQDTMARKEVKELKWQLRKAVEKQERYRQTAADVRAAHRQIYDDISEEMEEQKKTETFLDEEEREEQHELEVDQTMTVTSAMVSMSHHNGLPSSTERIDMEPVDVTTKTAIHVEPSCAFRSSPAADMPASVSASCRYPEIPHVQESATEPEFRPVEESGLPLVPDALKLALPQGHIPHDNLSLGTSKYDTNPYPVQETTRTEHKCRPVQETGSPLVPYAEKLVLPQGHIPYDDFPLGTSKFDSMLCVPLSAERDPSIHNGNCGNMDLMTVQNTESHNSPARAESEFAWNINKKVNYTQDDKVMWKYHPGDFPGEDPGGG